MTFYRSVLSKWPKKKKKIGAAKKQKVVTLEMKLESGCDVG